MRSTLWVSAIVTLAAAGSLSAQRRSTEGGSSETPRAAPTASTPRSSGDAPRATSSGGGRSTTSSTGSSGTETRRATRGSDGRTTQPQASRSGNSNRGRATGGKIASIRRSARDARAAGGRVVIERGIYIGGCYSCDYWGMYGGHYGWYHGGWWYPAYYDSPPGGGYSGPPDEERDEEDADVGYMSHPYAENDGTGATFVRGRTRERHAFGTVTGQYFADQGSTTRAGRFAIEGAYKALRGELEYGYYQERVAAGTDRLHTFRLGIAAQPAIGNHAFLIAGLAARGVSLGNNDNASGPEAELGLQVFPRRPLGVAVVGRLGALKWNHSTEYFRFSEVNTTASIHIGPMELQGGWHWMKLGNNAAFGGPMLGTRFWF